MARSGITVQRGVPAPAYYPGPDRVEMPNYSAFVCANLRYSYIEAQSPAYLDGWLKISKSDTRAIFSNASYASQAADWLRNGPKVAEPASNLVMVDAITY